MASATVMGLVFGQPKRTKTSTVASAFPNALWIPGEGANAILSVCQNEWGYEPTVYDHPIRTLDDLVDLLSVIEENNLTQEYGAICVDGMTALCESSLRYWQDNPKLTQSGKVDKFWPYQQLKDRLLRLAERGRHIGVNMFFVAHEQALAWTVPLFLAALRWAARGRWFVSRHGATSTPALWSTRTTPTRGSRPGST